MKITIRPVSLLMVGALFAGLLSAQNIFANDDQIKSQDSQDREYQKSLTVHYVMKATNDFAPAYADYSNRILSVWRDVKLHLEQVPGTGPFNYIPMFDLARTKFTVQEVTPPVYYVISVKGVVDVGYYDRGTHTFFVWKGFELTMPQVGIDAFKNRKLRDKDVSKTIEIPIPPSFWSNLFESERN